MMTMLKTYLIATLLLSMAVVGAFFALAGGTFGLPEPMDWTAFGTALGVLHGVVALFGLSVGGRKKIGRFGCMIVGLLFGLLGAFVMLLAGNKKPLAAVTINTKSSALGRRTARRS